MSNAIINSRRTHELTDDNTLCTVDNKCTRLCHQRKISHKNLMLVNLISLFIVETDSHF